VVAIAVAVVVFVVLAVAVHDRRQTWLDAHIATYVYLHARSAALVRFLTNLTNPQLEIGVLATLAVGSALRREWRVAVLAVFGPGAALFLSEIVFKPLVHRQTGGASYPVGDAFPSGHETGLVGLLAVLAVLLLRTSWRPAMKAAVLLVLAVWAVFGAIGLVRIFAHYASDTVGGMCVAVATVFGLALAVDAVAAGRVSESGVPDPPRRVPAA